MALDQHAANLVDTTLNAFNGDATSVSSMDGMALVDSWVTALRNAGQENNPVVIGLNELRSELQSGNPDGSRIQSILKGLGDQTKQAADSAEADVKAKLTSLVDALQGFSKQLGGSSKMAALNTEPSDTVMPGESGGQAPMTSTVGGESTNSGAGASSLRKDGDDQVSNRTGGTMDKAAPAADASTGSSDGDDYSAGSGTQSSGVSGGSAESGSGSSGGRSQY